MLQVEADEFDGKVVYGEKKKETGPIYEGHSKQLEKPLANLARLETDAQKLFLHTFYGKKALLN